MTIEPENESLLPPIQKSCPFSEFHGCLEILCALWMDDTKVCCFYEIAKNSRKGVVLP